MKSALIAGCTLAVCLCLANAAEADIFTFRETATYDMEAVHIRTDSSANQDGHHLHIGDYTPNNRYRSLLQFDLSAVPAGHVADSASLTLTRNRGIGSSITVGLYSYNYVFDETTAKWYYPCPQDTTPGGTLGELLGTLTYDIQSFAAVTFSSTAAFTRTVTDALANGQPLGLILVPLTSGTVSTLYDDSNLYVSNHPTLTLTTSVPEPATMALLGLGGLGVLLRRRR